MSRSGDVLDSVRRLISGRLTGPQRAFLAVLRPVPDSEYPLEEVLRLDRTARVELVELLQRHELGGWAYKVYGNAGVRLPDEVLRPLRLEYARNRARGILALSAYERLSEVLSRAGVDHLALRGIALFRGLYPDLGTRSFGDIDILVRQADVDRADAALRQAGYRGETPEVWQRQARYGHHHSYVAPPPFPAHVEVHWWLSSSFGVQWRGEWPWDRSSAVGEGNSRERLLDRATEVETLAIHAAKHGYDLSAKWLLDLRLAFEKAKGGTVTPQGLAERAAQSGSAAACGLVLALVGTVAGLECAGEYRDACLARIPPWRRPMIHALARPQVFLQGGEWLRRKWPRYALGVWLSDGWWNRVLVAARAVGFKLDLEGWI